MQFTLAHCRTRPPTRAHTRKQCQCRNPGLDDQIIFWRMIRENKDPPINAIGTCRNMDPVPSNSTHPHPDPPITTCFLDICMFASGMLRYFEQHLRYGEYVLHRVTMINTG